jgi:hypothetical protein
MPPGELPPDGRQEYRQHLLTEMEKVAKLVNAAFDDVAKYRGEVVSSSKPKDGSNE